MTEQILYYIIIALVGIIIGGAGGAAFFKRGTKGIIPNIPNSDDIAATAVTVAATATSTAAVVAATATSVAAALHTEISGQFSVIQSQLAANNDKLNELKETIAGFMGACPERHKAIDQRFEAVERKEKA